MPNINILDKNTIDKIAAGEVVDRPSSIVKELLENAIDAKATAVTIEIKDGGISLIRITDNGEGISRDDIRNAFLRHATSKINNAEDLLSIHSLGFRGEALSSIAAVSQVECISKKPDELIGIRYVIEGGEEKLLEEVGSPTGTTFIVRNVFYNIPARRKFLKTSATEGSYISTIVEKIALSHPDISIRFINNSQTKLHTSGNGKLKDIIYSIYGRDICSNVLTLDDAALDMKITGYAGKPVISRGNRNFMIYFINGRYIKSKIINSAIEEAYKPYMMQHNYPFAVIHFHINPELIDVNVHPSKMEIRFQNQSDVYNFFYAAVSNAIKAKELILEVTNENKEIKNITSDNDRQNKRIQRGPEPFETKRVSEDKRITEEKENTEDILLVREGVNSEDLHRQDTDSTEYNKERPKNLIKEDAPVYNANSKQMELFDNRFLSKSERIKHKMIGQLFDTYWLIEYDNNLYIIDQHAAHEKVLYEQTMKNFKDRDFTSQQLNPPIILTLTMSEAQLLEEYMDNFKELGYEIEHFGGKEYAVYGVPDNLYSIGSAELLKSLIDNLSEEKGSLKSEFITDKIASMSCKAAVKGNSRMSVAEANALIEQLLTLDNPYNCPHGRPTIISMSKYEIEKKFKRIL